MQSFCLWYSLKFSSADHINSLNYSDNLRSKKEIKKNTLDSDKKEWFY